jgi:pyruvate dehydrogenase E1 component alpha subunit
VVFDKSMTIARKKNSAPADSLSTHSGFSLISNEKLLELYATMLKCRMIEDRIHAVGKRKAGRGLSTIAAVHDAAIAGVAIDLLRGDTLAPAPGALIPCFVKGMPLAAICSSLFGGRARRSYASYGLIRPSLSADTQLERALRAASTNKSRKNKKIAVVFCGDFSALSSSLDVAMERAGRKRLPVLFVCQSGYDVEDVSAKAHKYGFPGVIVDGEDAVAVYRVATEAIAHARRGSGPTLIECKPWPLQGRKSARPRSTGNSIRNMETYLSRKGLFSRKFKSHVTEAFQRELDAAIRSTRG